MADLPGPRPVPDPDQGPSDDARFRPCFRHAERRTGISCQRCNRPICGECMRPASVGFQCPDCVSAGSADARQPRPSRGRGGQSAGLGGFGARVGFGVPVVLAAIVVLIGIADLILGGVLTQLMAWFNPLVGAGQVWRGLTWVLVSGGILSMIINALMIVLIGNAIESMVGGARTLALFFLSGLGGAAAIALLGGSMGAGIGVGSAIFGLLGANAALKFRQRMDVRPDLILFGLLIVMNLVIGGSLGAILGLVGGIVAGTVGGVAVGWAPGGPGARDRNQWLLLAGAALVFGATAYAGAALG